MKKNKMSLTTELDLTREGTAEMTRWCILIALHQSFGVGAVRLNRILTRAEVLGRESLDVAMTANDRGMPSTDESLALRCSWMPEGVDPDFRVPVLHSPRTRAARAAADGGQRGSQHGLDALCQGLYGRAGLRRGAAEPAEGRDTGQLPAGKRRGPYGRLDVALEHLRRCAEDALKEEVTVDEQPDEDRVRQSERDYEEQKRAF